MKGDEVTGTPSSVHEQLLAVHAADIVIQGEGVGGGGVVLEIAFVALVVGVLDIPDVEIAFVAALVVGENAPTLVMGADVVAAVLVNGVLGTPDVVLVVLDVLCTPGHTCHE